MKSEHLDDDVIQSFCDNADSLSRAARQHLTTCEQCRESVTAYRELYRTLGTVALPALSEQFGNTVMRAIAAVHPVPVRSRAGIPQWLWVGAMLAGAGTISSVVIGKTAFQSILAQFTGLWGHGAEALRTSTSQYFTALNLEPATVLMSVLAIGGVLLMDRALIRVRRTRRLLSLLA